MKKGDDNMPMDEQRYRELTEKYANELDGAEPPEFHEWMDERLRRKYEEVMKQQAKQKPAS